jgi:nucleoside-diphosphate-sugar epimerase
MSEQITILTGANSGLGKFFSLNMPSAVCINHENFEEQIQRIADSGVKVESIIHTAYDSRNNVVDYESYFRNNLLYTTKLLDLSPDMFVYISSTAVLLEENTEYKLCKLLSENAVKKTSNKHVIVRPTAILGPTMRKNSLVKILDGSNPSLTLHKDSTFGYVLQEDIFDFVNHCVQSSVTGTFNFSPTEMVSLSSVCALYDKGATFGEFMHKQETVDSQSLYSIFPRVAKTSIQNIDEFLSKNDLARIGETNG